MIPDETLQLLRAIYRGQREGYLTLTAIHPDHKDRAPSRHLHIRDKTAVHQGLQDLLKANAQGWGAYFSVALRREPLGRWKRGGFSDLLTLTVLYADLDGDLSTSFERIQRSGLGGMPAPSAMIGSGRGLHLYWLLDDTTDFQTANHVLGGLAQQLGGDEVRVTQALRLPGSRNTKPEVNRACKLLWLAENRRYTLGDFAAYVPPSPEPPPLRPRAPPPTLRRSKSPLSDQINTVLVEAVTDVLLREYGGFVQKNGWIGSLCPCGHTRDAPGKHFAFNPASACGVCLGRHARLLLKELCDLLRLDPADYGGLYRQS